MLPSRSALPRQEGLPLADLVSRVSVTGLGVFAHSLQQGQPNIGTPVLGRATL